MARQRCTWKTVDTCKMYELQVNEYDEIRVVLFGKAWKSFKGYNAHRDAKSFWNAIKAVNQ